MNCNLDVSEHSKQDGVCVFRILTLLSTVVVSVGLLMFTQASAVAQESGDDLDVIIDDACAPIVGQYENGEVITDEDGNLICPDEGAVGDEPYGPIEVIHHGIPDFEGSLPDVGYSEGAAVPGTSGATIPGASGSAGVEPLSAAGEGGHGQAHGEAAGSSVGSSSSGDGTAGSGGAVDATYEPEAGSVAAASGLSVLPDTGGPAGVLALAGAAVACGGFLLRLVVRR